MGDMLAIISKAHFKKIVERLRRIPSAVVRRFTVVEAAKPRAVVLELGNEATKHLARA